MCLNITIEEIKEFRKKEALKIDQNYLEKWDLKALNLVERESFLLKQFTVQQYTYKTIELIEEFSVNSVALIAQGEESSFVIKFSKHELGNTAIRHEVVVGILGTNLLQSIIPNFSYVHTFFSASKLKYARNLNVKEWLNSREPIVDYVVYENVFPSICLADYVLRGSSKQCCSVLLQIFHSLLIAHEKLRFTHYDLHPGNILIKYIEKDPFFITYNDLKVKCWNIATFIDYGSSYIESKDESYGVACWGASKQNTWNVTSENSNPLHDIFKLLGNLYVIVRPSDIFHTVIEECLEYFVKNVNFEIACEMSSEDFVFPRSSNHQSLIDFVNHANSVISIITPDLLEFL